MARIIKLVMKKTFNLKAVNQMLKLSFESTKEIFRLQEKIIGKI